jgi:hypothetical protein
MRRRSVREGRVRGRARVFEQRVRLSTNVVPSRACAGPLARMAGQLRSRLIRQVERYAPARCA